MSITLDQAIGSLLHAAIPITIANVFAAYIRIVGLDEDGIVEEATIIAFEHALDKYPIPIPAQRRVQCDASFFSGMRPYAKQVAEVRKEYWREKLGCENASRCTCTGCGKTVHYEPEAELLRGGPRYTRKAVKAKPTKKRKVRKALMAPPIAVPSDDASDNSGSSSSSAVVSPL